jgi:hypothetical protein
MRPESGGFEVPNAHKATVGNRSVDHIVREVVVSPVMCLNAGHISNEVHCEVDGSH